MIIKTTSKIGFSEFLQITRYSAKSSEQLIFSVYRIHHSKPSVKNLEDH